VDHAFTYRGLPTEFPPRTEHRDYPTPEPEMDMKIPSRQITAISAVTALWLVAAGHLQAQATPAPTAANPETTTEETVVKMSPFYVNASEDIGYRGTATLAGTRIKTDLKNVGSAISVVTEQFLQDTGARNTQDLLVYTTNTEVGGIPGNFAGTGNGQVLDETNLLRSPQTNTRVRGLAAADNTRDYFLTDIPWDSYNVQRIDMQRGPNGILFGLGSPAGIINHTTNGASFKEGTTVEARFGSYGSRRGVLDINHVLLKNELAIRIEGLRDDTEYRQDPAFNLDKRLYTALRYDPSFLNKGSNHGSFRVNYEQGDITADRPRSLPPGDNITPWWSFGKATYDPFKSWVVDTANIGASGDHLKAIPNGSANPAFNPWLGDYGNGNVLGGIYMTFPNQSANAYDTPIRTGELDTPFGRGANGSVVKSIGGIQFNRLGGIIGYSNYAINVPNGNGTFGLPYANLGQYKNTYITDPSIFNFWDKLIDGPNASQWEGFEAFDAAFSQTFLNNRLGIELVYDHQRYHNGQESGGPGNIQIDLNSNLIDGSPNPNVGRPYVDTGSPYGNNSYATKRDDFRVTAFGEFRFTDVMNRSMLTDILGRHVFTALYSTDKKDVEQLSWNRWVADPVYGLNYLNSPYMTDAYRQISEISYIGPSLLNSSSAAGANLSNVAAVQVPPTSGQVRIFDSHWNAPATVGFGDPYTLVRSYYNQIPDGLPGASVQAFNPANYVGWTSVPFSVLNSDTGDINRLYSSAAKSRDKIESKALVWQGFFWDDTLVGTVGIRKDTAKSYAALAPKNADNSANLSSSAYTLPSTPNNVVSGNSTSWSVVAHTPKFIKNKLPAGTDVSVFYNHSSNFQPAAGRVDIMGNPLGAPTGETKDYGFAISTLNDRLSLKVNWYKTTVKGASLDNVLPMYLIGFTEEWGYTFASINRAGLAGDPLGGPSWQWDYFSNPFVGQTGAQAHAVEVAADAAWFANLPPQKFFDAWHIDTSSAAWSNRLQTYVQPQGLTATGDTVSKGTEYELTAQITRNWDLAFNASHDSATRINLGGSLADWINARTAIYHGDAGNIRYWWAGSTDTIHSVWDAQFLSAWKLLLLQQGADVPELRPWHFNIVTNYRFTDGMLKGVNVGGGYRWQDGVIIGYPLMVDPTTGDNTFNLSSPYKGPSETNIDLWVGYERKLTSKIDWRIQLNIRNAFADKKLIPITAQPNGTPAAYRIPDLTSWFITNTFKF
jgi:outer membrane receptor for ferric coprogen and ferric-rhodotorulic acid